MRPNAGASWRLGTGDVSACQGDQPNGRSGRPPPLPGGGGRREEPSAARAVSAVSEPPPPRRAAVGSGGLLSRGLLVPPAGEPPAGCAALEARQRPCVAGDSKEHQRAVLAASSDVKFFTPKPAGAESQGQAPGHSWVSHSRASGRPRVSPPKGRGMADQQIEKNRQKN